MTSHDGRRASTHPAGPLGRNTRRGHKTPMVRSQFPKADALADCLDILRDYMVEVGVRHVLPFTLTEDFLNRIARVKANVGRGNDPAKTPRGAGRSGGPTSATIRRGGKGASK